MMCTFPIIVGAEEPKVIFTDGASGFTVSLESPNIGDTYQLWMTAEGGTEADLVNIQDEDDFLSVVKHVDFVRVTSDNDVTLTVACPEGAYGRYGVRVIRSIKGAETEDTYYTYKYVDQSLAADAIEDFMAVSDDTTFAELFETYSERELFDPENLGVLADENIVSTIGSEFALVRDLVLGADDSQFEAVPAELLSCAAGAVTYNALLAGDAEAARTEIAENGAWIKEYLPSDSALESYMRIFAASKDTYEDADGLRDILVVARDYSQREDADGFIEMFEEIADDISNADELKNALDWSVALSAIEGATRTEIEEILEENAELFGISTDSKDNKGVTIAQIARVFETDNVASLYGQDAFSEYFDGVVDELAEDDDDSKGSSSGRGNSGSRGGSSGSVSGPSKYVTDPVTPADNPETSGDTAEATDELPFADLDGVEWATEYIKMLYDMEIVNGVTEDTFEPNRPVTREEYVKMLVVAFNLSSTKAIDYTFADVPESRWSYPYVKAAYLAGVVNGMSKDYFGAGEPISRQDAAVMLYKAMELTAQSAELDFTDADEIADYAKEAVAAMAEAGLMNGMEDGSFAPNGQTTRAQAATMLGRALSYDGGGM